MNDKKIKVKDLATELGNQPKDVLAAAKELGIVSAKVAASSLTEAEVTKIKSHMAGPATSDKPEVIIRRRKASDAKEKPEPSVEREKVEAQNAETTPEAAEQEKSEPTAAAVEPQPPVKEDPKAEEAAEAAPAENAKKATAKKVTPPPVAAKIIKPAAKVEPTPEPQVEAAPAAVEAPVETEAPAAAEVVSPPKVAAPLEAAPVAEEAQDANKGNAKIIRPASFSAEPERNASGQTISSAPALPPRVEGEEGEPEDSVSSSKVRVISRPTAPVAPSAPAAQRQGQRPGQQPGQHQGQRRDGQAPRPPREGDQRPRNFGGQAPARPTEGRPIPANAGPLGIPQTDEQGRKKRSKGRRTVEFEHGARNEGDDAAIMRSSGRRKQRPRQKELPPASTQPMKAGKRVIKVEEFIRVSDLAHQLGLKAGEIIKVLFNLGVMATINQSLDIDTATLVANDFNYEVEKVGFFEEDVLAQHRTEDDESELVTRPPVITIMGHVDHGKTSLLDALRKTTIASGEAGGITQHIGAYHVKTPKGEIVFLDTPGHEAFTAMRARGAEVTDIVVLVVAADDGVMEQTREAINHAKAANVPIMVAVNKMDKPEANPERVKRELSEQGLVAEDWGGDTTFSYVSAKQRQGLDELLELLALQAEILELKANPKKEAMGHIVEAKLDKGRGALGTVLITNGTLRQGDSFVCGIHSGRVRAMFNDQGKKVKEAGPSMPVEVQGFEGVPQAGDEFFCLADDKTARRIAETRALKQRERELAKESKVTLETFLARKADDVEAVVLNLVVKSDVQGSLEAIIDAVRKLSTDKVRINIIHGGTGAISESDVLLATASNAIIIGFNVRPTSKAKELADSEKVDMRFYDIIYKLVEEIKSAMEGMLAPVSKEVYLGTADVRETFSVPKVGMVAGCHVSDGKITRAALARLLRDGVVIYTGKIDSLRRFKDDVREVAKGYECGIGLENYNDIKTGDVIEAYEMVEEAAKL